MTDQIHEQVQPLLAIYRELQPEQQQRLQAHLEQCAACAQELADFQEMDRRLAAWREQQRRFPHRRPDTAGLLAQIEATRRPAGRLQQLLAPLSAPARVAAALVAAVALIAIAGLFVAWFNALAEGGPLLASDGTPTPTTTASEAAARTIDPPLQALREAGAAVTAAPNDEWLNLFNDLFEGDISDLWDVNIDGEQAHIYAFDDEAAAGRAAATISRSGRSLTLQVEDGSTKELILDYADGDTPRYWLSGPSLIYYTGANEATLALLDRLFGPRIADGDQPDQPDRPGQGMAGGEWHGVTLQYDPYLAYDLRPEWRSSGSSQQLWLHLLSVNLHESAYAPALIVAADPIDASSLAAGRALTEPQPLTFENGSGERTLLETDNGETVYVAQGQHDGGNLHVTLIYPVRAVTDGYDPQPALLDALFSSLRLPDALEPPPDGATVPEPTATRTASTAPGTDSCAALPRPAAVLAQQIELDRLNLTILNPLTGVGCRLSTQAYAPGALVFSGDTLFYPRRDADAGTMTVWEQPLDGDAAPLSFTSTPALNAPWFGLAVSPGGDQVVWATFHEPGEPGARFRSTLWLGNLQTEAKTLLWQVDDPDTFPSTIEPLHIAVDENRVYFARRPYGIGGAGPLPGQYAALYTLSLDGGEPQPLFECDTPFTMCLTEVDFERRLLAVATGEGAQPALRILDFDGSLVRQYTPPPADNYVGSPIFSPDGSVAFITANLERPEGGPPLFRSAAVRLVAPPYSGEAQTLLQAGEGLFSLWYWLDANHLLAGDWQDGHGLAFLGVDGERIEVPQSGTATPLLILSANAALPTDPPLEPAPIAEPTGVPPSPDQLQTVEELVAHLQQAYSIAPQESDAVREALRPVVTRDFSFTIFPTGPPAYMDNNQQVLGHLSYGLFRPAEPQFIVDDIEAHLPPGVTPEQFYMGEQPAEAVVYATGWGGDGSAEALLYLTREQGALRWAGLALSRDNFAPLPELQTVALPAGLVYRLQNEWRQVQANGDTRLLLTHPGPLSFNPGATRALFAEQAEQTLTLFDFSGGGPAVARTLPIDFSLMHGSMHSPWLDEQTALLMVTEPGGGLTQGSIGQMALLNVVSGALELLPPELSIYVQPEPADDGAIFYDNLGAGADDGPTVWRQGQATPLALGQLAGLDYEPFKPSPSPDGTKVVARAGWPEDANLTGYWLFDLQQQQAQPILGYSPPGTDAILPSGVFWHSSSDWFALQPQTGDPLQSGVWVMRAGGSERQFLGVGTANPLWLPEGAQLLFNVEIEGQQRLQLLDLQSGDRFWVNAPTGATPVAAQN